MKIKKKCTQHIIKMATVASWYINRCDSINCIYCSKYFDESTWTHCEIQHDCCCECASCEGNFWYFHNHTFEELIHDFFNDTSQKIIIECTTCVNSFIENVKNNIVPANANDEFKRLFSYGCYMKYYILNLIENQIVSIDVNTLFNEASDDTIMYFMKYTYNNMTYVNHNMIYAYSISLDSRLKNLYHANRFQVLDRLYDLGIYNTTTCSSKSIVSYLIFHNSLITENLTRHLNKYYGADTIIETFIDLGVDTIMTTLEQIKPTPEISLNNLPTSISTLNVSTEPISESASRPFPTKLEILYCLPKYNTTTVNTNDIDTSIENSNTTFKSLEQFVKHQDMHITDAIQQAIQDNSSLNNLNHFEPSLYQYTVSRLTSIFS